MAAAAHWKFCAPIILAALASPAVAQNVDFVLYGEANFNPLNDYDGDERKRIYDGEAAAIHSYRLSVPPQTIRINTIKPSLDVNAWDAPRRTGLNLYFKIITHLYGGVSYNTFSEDCEFNIECLLKQSIEHDLRNISFYERDNYPERLSDEYISSELERKIIEFSNYFDNLDFSYELSDFVALNNDEFLRHPLDFSITCSINITGDYDCFPQGELIAALLEPYISATRGGAVAMLSQTAGLYALIRAHPDIRSEFERQAKNNEMLKSFRATAITQQKEERDSDGMSAEDIEKGLKALSYAAQWTLTQAGSALSASLIGVARLAFSMPGSSQNLLPMYQNYLSSAYASRTVAELQAQVAILEKAIATLNSWPQTESVAASIRNMEAEIGDIKAHIQNRERLNQHGYGVIAEEVLLSGISGTANEGSGNGGQGFSDEGNGQSSVDDRDGERTHGSDHADRGEDGDDRDDAPDDDVHEHSSPIDDRDDDMSDEPPSEPDHSEPGHQDVDMGGLD